MSRILAAALIALLPLFAAAEIPASHEQITLSFAPVVKKAVPAVVNIFTRHVEHVQASPLMNDPIFRQFFGNQNFGGLPRERVINSLGSGVIVDGSGVIVTSYHVVKGSEQITVILSDKREFEGHVEKVDERSDLAVLKVDTKGAKLPTIELRDSDTLEVGDLVLAIGNPFGVGQTVTSGIISALSRSEANVSDYQFFIQTDAAINPGNSGGALVDMQGKLIGINTAIYSHTGGYQGIGFAIPANMVSAVLKGQAAKNGALIRPWFGVIVQPVTREVADAEGLAIPRGVLVQQITPNSPAEKAGIKPGDIITALGVSPVDDPQSLNFRITTTGIGTPVDVSLWRQGKEVIVPVTFTIPPADTAKPSVLKGQHALAGVAVTHLTPEIAQSLHIKSDQERLVVTHGNNVIIGSIRIKEGDIFITVNGRQIHTLSDLDAALAVQTHQFQISLVRNGLVLTQTVKQ